MSINTRAVLVLLTICSVACGGSSSSTNAVAPTTTTGGTSTGTRSKTGTITVDSDQTRGTNTIGFSGTGFARIIDLTGDLAFGSVTVGESATRTLTIRNVGNGTLTWTGIEVTYDDGSPVDTDVYEFSPMSGTVGPDESANVVFTWSPQVGGPIGSFSGLVTVTSGDNFYPTKSIAWSATAVAP